MEVEQTANIFLLSVDILTVVLSFLPQSIAVKFILHVCKRFRNMLLQEEINNVLNGSALNGSSLKESSSVLKHLFGTFCFTFSIEYLFKNNNLNVYKCIKRIIVKNTLVNEEKQNENFIERMRKKKEFDERTRSVCIYIIR